MDDDKTERASCQIGNQRFNGRRACDRYPFPRRNVPETATPLPDASRRAIE
jgi:hypothetical protein